MHPFVERVGALDRALLLGLAARRVPRWLDRSLALLTHAGGAGCTIALPLVLLVPPRTHRLGIVLLVANALSHLAVQVLKRVVVRARPHLAPGAPLALAAVPDAFSFPSGHACAAMAVALPLVLIEGVVGLPALGLALIVGMSRVYLRVHYPTDVVVGQGIGGSAALAATALLG